MTSIDIVDSIPSDTSYQSLQQDWQEEIAAMFHQLKNAEQVSIAF
jgi:hypothetical protein